MSALKSDYFRMFPDLPIVSIPEMGQSLDTFGQYAPALLGDVAGLGKLTLKSCDPTQFHPIHNQSSTLAVNIAGIGFLGNACTGIYVAAKGASQYAESARNKDSEGQFLAGAQTATGACLFSSGTANSLSFLKRITSVASKSLGKLGGIFSLCTSFFLLMGSGYALKQACDFQESYFAKKTVVASPENLQVEVLSSSFRYLHGQLQPTQKEIQEAYRDFQNSSSAGGENLEAFYQKLDELQTSLKDQGLLNNQLFNLLRTRLVEKKITESLYQKKRSELARRISSSVVDDLADLTANALLEKLEVDARAIFLNLPDRTDERRNWLERCISQTEKGKLSSSVEDLTSKTPQEVFASAFAIDLAVKRGNLERILFQGLLVFIALVGIAAFIAGSVMSGGILLLVVSWIIGIVWTIIDSSLGEKAAGWIARLYYSEPVSTAHAQALA
ncbi:MAG: hypothetical protein AAGF04_05405 [Chlamydiota bacterium]